MQIAAIFGSHHCPMSPPDTAHALLAYSGEREHSFRLNVNTFFLNALPTEGCTSGVQVQSIS
jgi:hypothetical protein